MEFEEIPGVGSKTAEALAELPDAERALRAGDVATLASAPGVPEGRAARIARAAIRAEHDDPGGFLATDRARDLYRDVLGLLQERTVTTYGAKRLETFYPSATDSRIEEVQAFVAECVEREPTPEVLEALEGVEPLAPPRNVTVRDRCLVTTDAETYAEAREAIPEMSVEIVDDARGLADLARGYSTVVALDEAFAGVEVDGDVRVEPDALASPEAVVPERTLAFFAANRDSLRAAAALHRAADLDAPLDLDPFEAAIERIASDGTVSGDEEYARLDAALADLDVTVSAAEKVANDRLRAAIEERDVTIEGADLLSLVERGAGVDSLLSRELSDEYAEAVAAAREELVETLDLRDGEAEIARMAFPEEPTFPVEHEEGVVGRLREELTAARDRRATRQKRELARDLADEREAAETLVGTALELDVELAIARFDRDYDCTLPEYGGEGVTIEGGRSPLLDVPFEAVEPVDYAVEGVALLSGVNSGGKTSTLDLVAVCTILAQMGLPVPAEAMRCQRFEELHYHEKTQGTLDAGAFEATLQQFAALTDGDAERLVLVDELESITEPGASATIIAGILEELRDQPVVGVFVSHLAGEIREAADFPVPVDGIEAEGLVEGELVVNRSPVKDHLARSTPELIVEKLAGEDDSTFYGRLLEKFE
jgi:dsDNA-specific endonuclease/ATPase MutS2